MPIEANVIRTRTTRKFVAIEPAVNAFVSAVLVTSEHSEPGIHEWVTKTRALMTTEEKFRHKLVMIGLHYAVVPQEHSGRFENYIEQLEKTPPQKFRENLLAGYDDVYVKYKEEYPEMIKPDWNDALTSADKYISVLSSIFGEENTDVEIESKAYEYVLDPVELKKLVTSHLRWFWQTHMQPEWDRVEPILEESARVFNKLNLREMSRNDLYQFIVGKEKSESKWMELIDTSKNVVFVPNAHIGPYMRMISIQDTAYVVFGAHLPEGSKLHIPELDRAEIVSKLSALADDTRLIILQLLLERGEMRSTEIMDEVKLSQPSVSRYLAQLTASGYLNEKRINSAKVYTLNKERIGKTLQAVSKYLLGSTR